MYHHGSPALEKTRLILDCWRKVDSLMERIFRGLYVRCFLIFTDRRIIELKTSHYDIALPTTPHSLADPTLVGDDILSYLLWGPINYFFHKKIIKKMEEEGRIVEGAVDPSTEVSLEEALQRIEHIRRKLGLWSVKPSKTIPYIDIMSLKVREKKLVLRLRSKETIQYHCLTLEGGERCAIAREIILDTLKQALREKRYSSPNIG